MLWDKMVMAAIQVEQSGVFLVEGDRIEVVQNPNARWYETVYRNRDTRRLDAHFDMDDGQVHCTDPRYDRFRMPSMIKAGLVPKLRDLLRDVHIDNTAYLAAHFSGIAAKRGYWSGFPLDDVIGNDSCIRGVGELDILKAVTNGYFKTVVVGDVPVLFPVLRIQ